MSALYLSISRDQASSLPARHSCTIRVSSHAVGGLFGALALTALIEWLARPLNKAVRHSTECKVPRPQDGNCRLSFFRRPECPDSREKSWAVAPRESPGHGR